MPTKTNYDKLIKWIRKSGGYVLPDMKIVVSNVDNVIERSVYATKLITNNSDIVRIPKKCRIHPELVYEIQNIDKWVELDNQNRIKNNALYRIVIALIYQKILGRKSFHYPYIRVLPKMFDLKNHFIYNYNEQNLAEWEKCSTPFASSVKTDKKVLEELIIYIEKWNSEYTIFELDAVKFGNEDDILAKLVTWAFVIYMTRAWHDHGCVPYADLLNHSTSSKMSLKYIKSGYDTPVSKSFPDFSIMRNGNIYDIGEEIFNNYGHYDGKKLLINYGFSVDEEIQYLEVQMNFTPSSSLHHYIKSEIDKFNIPKKTLLLTTRSPSARLIKYLRLISLDTHDIAIVRNVEDYPEKVISLNNELSVYKTLLKLILGLRTNEYTTERYNDCQILRATSNNPVTLNLATIVLKEFQILKNNTAWVHANWLTRLDTPFLKSLINHIINIDV